MSLGILTTNLFGFVEEIGIALSSKRGVNRGLPPVWMMYLPVGDLVESIRRVEEEGGEVIKAVRGEDGKYVYAAVQDPVGAYLAFVQD
jgi:uncharacterized protein